jgi:protease II
MGAVANQHPELYRAIIAHVPFVDAVTTMLDDTIPLTSNEYDDGATRASASSTSICFPIRPTTT